MRPRIVFESAMADLTRRQASAFRVLAVPQGPDFSLSAAAVFLDLPLTRAESVLEALVDAHLLEVQGERYCYLKPIREYARAKALLEEGAASADAGLLRLADFYTVTLSNALQASGPLTLPGLTGQLFSSPEQARAWMHDEQVNLWETAAQTAGIPDAPGDLQAELITQAAVELTGPMVGARPKETFPRSA